MDHRAVTRLLMIADDQVATDELLSFFVTKGYELTVASHKKDEVRKAKNMSVDLYIVGIMDQLSDGLSAMRLLSNENFHVPTIVIDSSNNVEQRVAALNAGFDDYFANPFSLVEIEARIHAVLRRQASNSSNYVQLGPVLLNRLTRQVHRNSRKIDLLNREFQILEYMMQRPGQIVTRGALFAAIWNYGFQMSPNLIDVHIGKLRKKLTVSGECEIFETIKGEGFLLLDGISDNIAA